MAKLPAEWVDIPGHHGARGADGITFAPTHDGLEIRVGPVAESLFAAGRQVAATWARAGCNVLVDEVTLSEPGVNDWRSALAGLDVMWVAVHCDPDVNDAREASRGDRHVGLARVQRRTVHAFAHYDLELDATHTSAGELADRLIAALST